MNGSLAFSWFRLFSIKGYGAASLNRIFAKAQANDVSIPQLFELERDKILSIFQSQDAGIYEKLHSEEEKVRLEYERLLGSGIEIIHPEHPLYPGKLRTLYLDQAPPVIFAKGRGELLQAPGLAVVGSRDADETALDFSLRAAGMAAACGFNVVSGYARGVDTLAHLGAIKGGGTTTIVLSYGFDHFRFKSAFAELAPEKNSLVISQFHPRETWNLNSGMIRNRLIAGLSSAVIVITAAEKSGTANTGNLALKAGLPLFVFSPKFYAQPPPGNVQLLEQGGVEITSFPHLQECLAELYNRKSANTPTAKDNQANLPL